MSGTSFIVWLVGLSTVGWVLTTWIRARHGYPIENEWSGLTNQGAADSDRKIELLSTENEKLTGQIGRLEERLAVLERIVTDPTERVSRDIEALR